MNYFNELLSTLKGDDRAQCFVLWKNSRTELSQITEIINKFDVSRNNPESINYSMDERTLQIKEPSVADILGEEVFGSNEGTENTFASGQNSITKSDRDKLLESGNSDTQPDKTNSVDQKKTTNTHEEKNATHLKKGSRKKDI